MSSNLDKRNNNFDLVHLFLSLGVLCSYSFDLFLNPLSFTWVSVTRIYPLGVTCCFIFFGISGYLIYRSFFRDPSITNFITKRFIRLWPALLICSLFTVFLIGSLTNSLPLKEYFTNYHTWLYLKDNLSLWWIHISIAAIYMIYINYEYIKCKTPSDYLLIELKSMFLFRMIFNLYLKYMKASFLYLCIFISLLVILKKNELKIIMYHLILLYLFFKFALSTHIRKKIKINHDISYGIYEFSVEQTCVEFNQ